MDNLTKDLELMAYRARYHQDFIKPQDQADFLEKIVKQLNQVNDKCLEDYEKQLENLEDSYNSMENELNAINDKAETVKSKLVTLFNHLPHIDKRRDIEKELAEIIELL